jgi:hypothetical protein
MKACENEDGIDKEAGKAGIGEICAEKTFTSCLPAFLINFPLPSLFKNKKLPNEPIYDFPICLQTQEIVDVVYQTNGKTNPFSCRERGSMSRRVVKDQNMIVYYYAVRLRATKQHAEFCAKLACCQLRTRLDGTRLNNLLSPARWTAEPMARPNNFQRLTRLTERFVL